MVAAVKPWFTRKRTWLTAVVLLLLLALFFRERLLHAVGAFLITEDVAQHADVLYVLGGAPFDRGSYAAHLLASGVAPIAYTTGSNFSAILKAEGREVSEAELSRMAAIRAGASTQRILPFPFGTSTFEEAQGVLHHAQRLEVDTIVVLTTDFHTRRVGKVFRKRFAGSGIHVLVASAPSSDYDADRWWTSEQGLLMVNNEYVKTLFYALKY
ncbi:MAG TPA: YdcF family protein [Flavobacteriales bacterium]|nr:YdcF family protein [Flavobacteriales bacterium]